MLTEMLVVGGATIALTYYSANMEKRYSKYCIKKWASLMESLGIKNKLNETFVPNKINTSDNAIIFTMKIPAGFTVSKLEDIQDEISSYFKGVTTIKKIKFSDYCIVKIITQDLADYIYEPFVCSNSELYIGKTLDSEDYTIDLTKGAAHLLIGAPSGKGKSFLLASILTNLIYNANNTIDLFLLQLKKGDVGIFEKCTPTKYCAYTLEDIYEGLKTLVQISDDRSDLFNSLGVKHLKHFNKLFPANAINRVYVVLEEISFFMPSETDSSSVKTTKASCLEILKTLVKIGRSSGIHIISVCQRSTVENIPSTMKSMMIRISLGQISSIDSLNIIESEGALYLENKECLVYGYEPGEKLVHIPSIDEDFKVLQKYVSEIKIPEITKKPLKNIISIAKECSIKPKADIDSSIEILYSCEEKDKNNNSKFINKKNINLNHKNGIYLDESEVCSNVD